MGRMRTLETRLLRCSQCLQLSGALLRPLRLATQRIPGNLGRRGISHLRFTFAVSTFDPFQLLVAKALSGTCPAGDFNTSKRDLQLTFKLSFRPLKPSFRKAQRIWSGIIFGRIGASFMPGNCRRDFSDIFGNRRRRCLCGDFQEQKRQ